MERQCLRQQPEGTSGIGLSLPSSRRHPLPGMIRAMIRNPGDGMHRNVTQTLTQLLHQLPARLLRLVLPPGGLTPGPVMRRQCLQVQGMHGKIQRLLL